MKGGRAYEYFSHVSFSPAWLLPHIYPISTVKPNFIIHALQNKIASDWNLRSKILSYLSPKNGGTRCGHRGGSHIPNVYISLSFSTRGLFLHFVFGKLISSYMLIRYKSNNFPSNAYTKRKKKEMKRHAIVPSIHILDSNQGTHSPQIKHTINIFLNLHKFISLFEWNDEWQPIYEMVEVSERSAPFQFSL